MGIKVEFKDKTGENVTYITSSNQMLDLCEDLEKMGYKPIELLNLESSTGEETSKIKAFLNYFKLW